MKDIDSIRSFWDSRPCNINHSNAPLKSTKYFTETEKRKYFVEPHILKFAEFSKWNNKKVLEIGCGIGIDASNFVRAGASYTGIELSQKTLDVAMDRFDALNIKGNFYCGNAEEIDKIVPIEDYDLVYSFGVIHHTPNPEKIINNIKKYMSNRSEFRLMLYAKNSWKAIMIEAGIDQPEAQFGCPIANTYDYGEIRELLKDYNIISIEQDHIFPYVVKDYIKYKYKIAPWFEKMSVNMFRVLEKTLGWHTLIRCSLKNGG